MGKPYASELNALKETYGYSLGLPVDSLAALLRSGAALPLVSVGSGGSLTSAHLAALLHTHYTGKLAKAMTPLELVSSSANLRDLAVLVVTAGGRNPDVLGCFERVVRREPKLLGVLCARIDTPLAQTAASRAFVHEFELPSGKDGFLATNTLLATCVLLARAYGCVCSEGESLPGRLEELMHPGVAHDDFLADLRHQARPLWERQTLVVLHGSRMAKCEAKNRQISLEGIPAEVALEAWESVEQLLREVASPGVTALRSSHSIDVLAPGVCKRALVDRVRAHLGSPAAVLCIGDRGRWPGNDHALLQEPLSLSVDEASADPQTCWNLAAPGRRCVEAALEYLRAIRVAAGVFTLNL